jgi:hypothetical protein
MIGAVHSRQLVTDGSIYHSKPKSTPSDSLQFPIRDDSAEWQSGGKQQRRGPTTMPAPGHLDRWRWASLATSTSFGSILAQIHKDTRASGQMARFIEDFVPQFIQSSKDHPDFHQDRVY